MLYVEASRIIHSTMLALDVYKSLLVHKYDSKCIILKSVNIEDPDLLFFSHGIIRCMGLTFVIFFYA